MILPGMGLEMIPPRSSLRGLRPLPSPAGHTDSPPPRLRKVPQPNLFPRWRPGDLIGSSTVLSTLSMMTSMSIRPGRARATSA